MNSDPTTGDTEALSRESQAIWDENAAAWDARMGAGGSGWQRDLIAPPTERLLAIRPGERVLDIACGNGAFARRLAALGATVAACDFSAALIARARAYPVPQPGAVAYHVVDATSEAQLLALGPGPFAAAVCTMALMDMATIEPLMSALARLLAPGGRFVFSVAHPCFHTQAVTQIATASEQGREMAVRYALQIDQYLSLGPSRGVAIREQPALQYYFDRPLHVLFGAGFTAGLVLDGLEEPPAPAAPATNPFSWANYREFPPVLVARMRRPAE